MSHPFLTTAPLRPAWQPPSVENLYAYYTARFTLTAPAQSTLYLWTEGLAEAACNGVCFHQGPCRSSDPLLYYDAVPVPHLRPGENRLSFKVQTDRLTDRTGLLAALWVDGSPVPLTLHGAWLHSYAPDAPQNSGAGFSEVVTLGSWEDRWFAADAPVPPARAVEAAAVSPAYLIPRPIPLFHEQERLPLSVIREEDGAYLADFGEMVFGRVEISGTGGAVILGYIEDLELGWSNAEGKQEMYQDRFLAGGSFTCKTFRKRAMRYLRIRGAEAVTVRVLEYGYPVEALGQFRCSDERLNRLTDIGRATLRVNMDDIYNDCPHRDQSQWMDAYLSSRAALALFGDVALARKCLYQHALCSYDGGRIFSPSVSSAFCDGTTLFADYCLMFFDYLLWFHRVTGETEILSDLQPRLRAVLEFYRRSVDETGLLATTADMDMVYLDNTFELAKKPHSAGLNALFYMAMDRYAQLCAILGQPEEAALWQTRAAALQQVFFRVFAHPTEPCCLVDADGLSPLGYYTVNFTCELGRWHSTGAVLEFALYAGEESLTLEVAEYTGFRLFCNGALVRGVEREPDWRRQPNYDPCAVTLQLKQGWNELRWEVSANQLNFELFFRAADGRELVFAPAPGGKTGYARMTEVDFADGRTVTPEREIRVRRWVPPYLTQSTHMYACISGIYPEPAMAARALERIQAEEYFRTYLSVRVPYFCTEAGEARERDPWIMPVNTPWPGSFLLQAMGRYGLGGQGLSLVRQFWGGMLDRGAVNTWEEWGTGSSLCHAWGATPAHFFLSRVLGVDHTTAADGYLLIRPCLFDLQWAEGTVAVGRDGLTVGVSLKKEADGTHVSIRVPEGVHAKIDLSLLEAPKLL